MPPNIKSPRYSEKLQREICEHMNTDHSQTVLLYAKHIAGKLGVTSAKMTSIDSKGFFLHILDSKWNFIRIEFEKPLKCAEEARSELVKLAKLARATEIRQS